MKKLNWKIIIIVVIIIIVISLIVWYYNKNKNTTNIVNIEGVNSKTPYKCVKGNTTQNAPCSPQQLKDGWKDKTVL